MPYAMILLCAIAFTWAYINSSKEIEKKKRRQRRKTRVRNVPRILFKNEEQKSDPNINEAKKMLVDMGYTAAEAKDLLSGIDADSIEDYISQAMQKVKI